MTHYFSQFCTCGTAGYAALSEQIDSCAVAGHSYEFHPCYMPPGCSPVESTLGFWHYGTGYLLYFRPTICYTGEDPLLAHFFSRDRWYFSDFSTLAKALSSLKGSLVPAVPPPFQHLFRTLQGYVVGQDEAVESVAFKLYGHISKQSPRRPLSLIFYGPTGVGKSELAKSVASTLCQCTPHNWQTVWTELNTFTEAHSAYRLIGAPPGYVGYDDPPILESVTRNPYTVFVFDELEKAHPDILKIFMSILDEGRCTARREDAHGNRELDFRHCVFLFTSNADLSSAGHPPGFSLPQEDDVPAQITSKSLACTLAQRIFHRDETARQALTRSGVLREIAGRFSGLVAFQPLDEQARFAVTARQVAALGREHGLNITEVTSRFAATLTPETALSPRSTVGILEGVLTPLFLSYAVRTPPDIPLQLDGTVEAPFLHPVS